MATTKIRKGQIENLQIINVDIASSAAIATSKLAEGSTFMKNDGSVVPLSDWDFNNRKITNLGAPVAGTDAARLVDIQNAQAGISAKEPVRVVSTTNIATLSGTATAIDGVTLAVGDRILLTAQTTGSQNGIYVVQSGAWVRADDFDGSPETIKPGTYVFVSEGTNYADSGWILSTNGTITIGTTALTFVQFSGAGQILAGAGLTKNGNTLALATCGTAGTYAKVTVDAYGRVTGGTALVAADIPVLDWSKITTGKPTTLSGYGITDAQPLTTILTAIAALATTGLIARTGAGTVAVRSIAQGTGITVTNGDGVSGNPTIALATSGVAANTYTSVTVDVYGRVTAGSNISYIAPANYIVNETPSGTVNGSNTVFTIANTPVSGKEQVFLNGILMESGSGNDYTISGATITFAVAPLSGDKVRVTYIK